MHRGQNRGKSKKSKLNKNCLEIGGIYNMHNWLSGMDAPGWGLWISGGVLHWFLACLVHFRLLFNMQWFISIRVWTRKPPLHNYALVSGIHCINIVSFWCFSYFPEDVGWFGTDFRMKLKRFFLLCFRHILATSWLRSILISPFLFTVLRWV